MHKLILLILAGHLMACSGRKATTADEKKISAADSLVTSANGFGNDRQFLRHYHPDLIELQAGKARALICPAYQGRVMTSTADGRASYGWINYDLIRSRKILPHMNAFGGEDRFWLGPEGGQYALFFKKGEPFDSDHWQTPAAIDSEPFRLANQTDTSATFTRTIDLTNYAGTRFTIGVERIVSLVGQAEVKRLLGVDTDSLQVVGIRSANCLTNKGIHPWTAEKGLPSIWILSMLNASPKTTIIVPFRAGGGPPIQDSYFGKVPAERLQIGQKSALFKADAQYRSKIGVSPARAATWIGSYDRTSKTLTLVTYSFNPVNRQYVNSAWAIQKEPYAGDVVNAYNDGPMKPGQPQMGKFYELESSSPAAALAPKARLWHQHTTIHVQGNPETLKAIARRLLQTELDAVQ